MKEKSLSPAESLDLINQMIDRARKRYTDSSFYLLLWGWLVIIAAGLHYFFAVEQVIDEPQMAWSVMFAGAIISVVHSLRKGKRSKVSNYTDKIYGWLWLGLGFAMIIVIINGQYINYQIIPAILMLAGVGTFVSGAMVNFRFLQFGAVCLWIMSIYAFQLNEIDQLPIMAIGIAIGYLLPGYVMKYQFKRSRGL